MSFPAIYQFVAGFRQGDAITNAALVMRAHFRQWGSDSQIVCERQRTAPQMRGEALEPQAAAAALRRDDIALLQLSIGAPINRFFAELPCRKVIYYQNITPERYFRHLNPALADELQRGRREAAALAGVADINLAASSFNASELRAMGYRDIALLPLPIDLASLAPAQADEAMRRRLSDGTLNVLFVGRCVPNKKLEDILDVMHYLQRHIVPTARLVHVGSYAGAEIYHSLLIARARGLGLRDTRFLGPVTQAQLNACYATAHVLLCMSEHEGYCAPLIEAMLHGVPVVARAAAAVPETLDGAGVLLQTDDLAMIAETVGRVLLDMPLRAAILRRQQRRIAAFKGRDLSAELRGLLAPLLPPAGAVAG